MDTDITQTDIMDVASTRTDYAVDAQNLDSPSGTNETEWGNKNFSKWLGYYKAIPEVAKPIGNYATWVVGKGIVTDARTQAILDGITGWGEDSFLAVLWNLLVTKKFNGDSYAEIVRDDQKNLINLKPLNAGRMKTITNPAGVIIRYDYTLTNGKTKKLQPEEILHLCNNRIGDEIHGTSVIEAAEWLILARNEAMEDWKRVSHRSTVRILYVDEDDKTRRVQLRKDYAEAIEKGEVLIIPAKKGEAEFQDLNLPPVEAFLAWIRYTENAIYKAVEFPKSLTGDAEGIPESGGKMAYFNHMPNYNREVTDLQNDLWNQVALRLEFKEQASLTDSMNDTENKNQAQTGFQPSDTTVQ